MDETTLERIKEIYDELAGFAKVHKRECGECGDWANLEEAAEALGQVLWESGVYDSYGRVIYAEPDPMTILKQRMEDDLV